MSSVRVLVIFIVIVRINCFEEQIHENVTIPEDTAEEIQHAICQITTKDVQTSANATVKRQLKGVCTSNQIERKFKRLESKLLSELSYIKSLLTNTNDRIPLVKTVDDYDYFNYDEKSFDGVRSEESVVSVTEVITRDSSWTRTEIDYLNNTVFTLKGEKVYTYFWEIANAQSVLHRRGTHIRSADFYVLGHELCIQLYPKHLDTEYLGIQLRPSSNFMKKHKFTILEPMDANKDINSQTLGGVSSYEEVYRVPYAKLQERHYLHNDHLILKLTIYLNS